MKDIYNALVNLKERRLFIEYITIGLMGASDKSVVWVICLETESHSISQQLITIDLNEGISVKRGEVVGERCVCYQVSF